MGVSVEDTKIILNAVKEEPKTIQELSKLIGRSWVTTNTYVEQIIKQTGEISVKIFRGGTQGALKIAFYNTEQSLVSTSIKAKLANQILLGRTKTDFEFLDVYQFIPEDQKVSFAQKQTEKSYNEHILSILQSAKRTVHIFSGNLSLLVVKAGEKTVIDVLEGLCKEKIRVKILCRINFSSQKNMQKIQHLLEKYSEYIEIRHTHQPLRGFIVDEERAQFKDEQYTVRDEVEQNMVIFYEINNKEWIGWLDKVFWNIFRSSLDYKNRIKELEKVLNVQAPPKYNS